MGKAAAVSVCVHACVCASVLIFLISPPACRSTSIDLVLLIDGSKSVRPQNFELVKKFVNQVSEVLMVLTAALFPATTAGNTC